MITGATGAIGSMVVDTILKNCQPNNVSLFCRDKEKLDPQIQQLIATPDNTPNKRIFAYEVDLVENPIKITSKVH